MHLHQIANTCTRSSSYADLPFVPVAPPPAKRQYGWCPAPARFQHFPLWQSWEDDGMLSEDDEEVELVDDSFSTATSLWRPEWEPKALPQVRTEVLDTLDSAAISIPGLSGRTRLGDSNNDGRARSQETRGPLQKASSFDSAHSEGQDVATSPGNNTDSKILRKTNSSVSMAQWGMARKRSMMYRSPRAYTELKGVSSILTVSKFAKRWVKRVRERLAARKAGAVGRAESAEPQTPYETPSRAETPRSSAQTHSVRQKPASPRKGSSNRAWQSSPAVKSGVLTGLQSAILNDVRSLPTPLEGHIIVAGQVQGLDHFLTPLRSSHLLNTHLYRPVVVLSPKIDPASQAVQNLLEYDDVFLVCGQPNNIMDLHR